MPVGFGVAHVDGFPPEAWQTGQQTSFENDDDAATAIEPVEDWKHPLFRKFAVRHESRLHFEGRYHNQPIDTVVRIYRFNIYLDPDSKTAYVCAPKHLWHEAFRRIEKDQSSTLVWSVDDLDLAKLRATLQARIGGGWFGKLSIDKVDTAGIFGHDVASSDEWEHYETLGKLNAVLLQLSFEDADHTLMLGQDGTILLYRDAGEMNNLAFLLELRRLISDALT